MPQHLEIYIDKIVVEGLDELHGPSFRAALEAQLGALLLAPGQAFSPGAETYTHRLNGGNVTLSDNNSAEGLGQRVAHNIFQSIQSKNTAP